jgi:hypothetical protein
MVYQDAFARLLKENISRAAGLSPFKNYTIPDDQDIKLNGYEGAVDRVYQQMNPSGATE